MTSLFEPNQFFEILKISPFDILNFEIKNSGFQNVNVVVMFSEDLKNSIISSNLNSPGDECGFIACYF